MQGYRRNLIETEDATSAVRLYLLKKKTNFAHTLYIEVKVLHSCYMFRRPPATIRDYTHHSGSEYNQTFVCYGEIKTANQAYTYFN